MIENLSSLFWKCLSFLLEKKKEKSLFWVGNVHFCFCFVLFKEKEKNLGNAKNAH